MPVRGGYHNNRRKVTVFAPDGKPACCRFTRETIFPNRPMCGISDFPNNHILLQLSLIENVLDMYADGRTGLAEQLADLLLREPYSFILEQDIDLDIPVLGLVNYNFALSYCHSDLFSYIFALQLKCGPGE